MGCGLNFSLLLSISLLCCVCICISIPKERYLRVQKSYDQKSCKKEWITVYLHTGTNQWYSYHTKLSVCWIHLPARSGLMQLNRQSKETPWSRSAAPSPACKHSLQRSNPIFHSPCHKVIASMLWNGPTLANDKINRTEVLQLLVPAKVAFG